MNKQTLFATGGTHRADGAVALTPADKGVLELATRLTYRFSDSARYDGRKGYRARFEPKNLTLDQMRSLAALCMQVSPMVRGFYRVQGYYFDLYTDSTYQFHAKELVEHLSRLYSQVRGLPDMVDDDQYLPTAGRVVSVPAEHHVPSLDYIIPFDRAAWEARHRQQAEVDTADAEAKRKQAEADQAEADAQRTAQKARLMKTLRVALVALAIATVVVILALIIKKK